MDRMTLLMLGILAAAPCACSASTRAEPTAISLSLHLQKWQPFVAQANRRFGIPQTWTYAVMNAESGGRTMLNGRPIVSRAGAIGLMQLMPSTYEMMRIEQGLGPDPQDPRDNILAGTAYLRAMYDRFGFPGLFAAYNAGPERYEDYVQRGRPLPAETAVYLDKIKATGVSDADIGPILENSVRKKPPKTSSGRELFFLKRCGSGRKLAGKILMPLQPEKARSECPSRDDGAANSGRAESHETRPYC